MMLIGFRGINLKSLKLQSPRCVCVYVCVCEGLISSGRVGHVGTLQVNKPGRWPQTR